MSLLLLLQSSITNVTVVAPAALVTQSASGLVVETIVAPARAVTASVVAPASSRYMTSPIAAATASAAATYKASVVPSAYSATASRAQYAPRYPTDLLQPTDTLLPESGTGQVPVVKPAAVVPNVTASRPTAGVLGAVVPAAASVTASRAATLAITRILVSVPAVGSVSAVGPVPMVAPLVTPAANARAEQFRLLSPTGLPEPPYALVTIRQLV